MRVTAIIAAAGAGRRLGSAKPKQLLEIGGGSMLQHSLKAFYNHPRVREIVVVLPPGAPDALVLGGYDVAAGPAIRVARGGARRQDSVANAFNDVSPDADVVLIHDAARPFVSAALIDRTIDAAAAHGAAITAVQSRDTVKRVGADGVVSETIPRETIYLAQTPQGFRRDVLAAAIAAGQAGVEGTDEAALAERAGYPVHVVHGDPGNVKITTADDLEAARGRMAGSGRPGRHCVGTGYDLHVLVEGRPLVIGGVTVASDRGALGHSDADVACHAATDAILGAASLGDIGRHFPDTDPRWKDADSLVLLAEAARMLRDRGYAVGNLDVTVILERPKIKDAIDEMRARLASALGIDVAGVSVKGKTNEGVDAIGRGEAIAAHAVALLHPTHRDRHESLVRFAPSPTGHLHVGNARTALFNWLLARGHDATFILRIEDTDAERSTRESEESILDDLRWLRLEWDEGPDVGGACGPYRQSERLHLYNSYANELLGGGHAYYCFCSAQQLEAERRAMLAAGRPPQYAGTCRAVAPEDARRRLDAGERAVIRFRVPEHVEVSFQDQVRGDVTFSTDVIGDPVLVRSDGRPAYNFAVVVDDALMEITHVIRGEDHISNTPRQVLLYRALGFTPPQFAHLSLVLGPDHTPLSKRHGATSVMEFRERGYLPEALTNYLALIGWSPRGAGGTAEGDAELMPLDELARRFALEDVGHSAGVFDPEKLAWMNRHYMKAASPSRIVAETARFFLTRGFLRRKTETSMAYLESLLPMAVGSVDRLEEIPDRLAFLFAFDAGAAVQRAEVADVLREPGAREVVAALAGAIDGPMLDRDSFRAAANRVKEKTGLKGKSLFHPIRVALTGESGGPELDLAVPAMDRGAALPADAGIATIMSAGDRARAFAAAAGAAH